MFERHGLAEFTLMWSEGLSLGDDTGSNSTVCWSFNEAERPRLEGARP